MENWNRNKKWRYMLFCFLHFFMYNLQPGINEEEQDEFVNKYHDGDPLN